MKNKVLLHIKRKRHNGRIFLYLAVFAFAVLYFLSCFFGKIASILNYYLCQPIRSVFLNFFDAVNIPIFEFAIAFSPLILAVLIAKGIENNQFQKAQKILSVFILSAVLLYAVNIDIPSKTDLKKSHGVGDITEKQCIMATERVVLELNRLCSAKNADEMAYSGEDVRRAVEGFSKRHFSYNAYVPRAKNSIFPELLTEGKILAYYSFLTFEIYVNTEQPEYMSVFTLAHEMMHTLGVTREDEANLFAFDALYESENPYLKYSAVLRAFEYIAPIVYSYSTEKYSNLISNLPQNAIEDIKKSAIFTKMMTEGEFALISDEVNDKLISLRDSRGSESYSNTAVLLIFRLTDGM